MPRYTNIDKLLDTLGFGTVIVTLVCSAAFAFLWATALPFIGLLYLMGVLR